MKSYKDLYKKAAVLASVLLAMLAFCSFPAMADAAPAAADAKEIAKKGEDAYNKGEYEEAVNHFKRAIEVNGPTATLLYDLGNAYYKSGNEGEARLCLERAKRLDPSNDKINGNIEYLASRIQDANKAEMKGKKGSVAPDQLGFFGKVRKGVAVDTASNSWAEMAAMAFVLLILSVALYVFSTAVKMKKIGFFSSFIFLFFSVVFIIFAEMAASQFERKDEVVITSFKSTLLAEPESEAKSVGFPLHRGTKLLILDSGMNADGKIEWYKVKLNSNNIGWIPADAVSVI